MTIRDYELAAEASLTRDPALAVTITRPDLPAYADTVRSAELIIANNGW